MKSNENFQFVARANPALFAKSASGATRDYMLEHISNFLARHPEWEPLHGPVTYYDPYRLGLEEKLVLGVGRRKIVRGTLSRESWQRSRSRDHRRINGQRRKKR